MSVNCIRLRSCASSAIITAGFLGAMATSWRQRSIRSVKSRTPSARLYPVHFSSNWRSVSGQPCCGIISPRKRLNCCRIPSPSLASSAPSSAPASSPSSLPTFLAGVSARRGFSRFHSSTQDSAITGAPRAWKQCECSVPILSGLMGKSRPASSAAAVREKDVTRTDPEPYRSTACRIWRERVVVLPVPGGPKMRYSDVTLWSRWPISSRVPVACSLGTDFLLERRVLGGIKLIHRQDPPALLLELGAPDPDALAAKHPHHRRDRLDGQVLEGGLVDVHLQVAGG